MGKNKTGRNEPCPCGSELKYKFCHGDPTKLLACKDVMNRYMAHLIIEEKIKRGMIERPQDTMVIDYSPPEEKSKIILP